MEKTQLLAMDYVFRDNYINYIFCLLRKIEPKWRYQIINLHDLWDDMEDLMDKDKFSIDFVKKCTDVNLPAENFQLDDAFEKVNRKWKSELMLHVVDQIIKYYDDDIPFYEKIVSLDKGCIRVDTTMGKHNAWYVCS